MRIIRNPRSKTSFEDPKLLCSVCLKTNSYFYQIHPNIRICKGCLNNMIKEIDNNIIQDIKSAKI